VLKRIWGTALSLSHRARSIDLRYLQLDFLDLESGFFLGVDADALAVFAPFELDMVTLVAIHCLGLVTACRLACRLACRDDRVLLSSV
jgi:hypothetical protein